MSVPSWVGAVPPHLLVILGVLGVALLDHLPLPPLLLQRLLDQLGHLALLPRLLPPDEEPAGMAGTQLGTGSFGHGGPGVGDAPVAQPGEHPCWDRRCSWEWQICGGDIMGPVDESGV